MIEIPLKNLPAQSFNIVLDGVRFDLKVRYNSRAQFWAADFLSDAGSVYGIPLVAGVDVLEQHLMPIKNVYMLDVATPDEDPGLDELGTRSKLVMLEEDEVIVEAAAAQITEPPAPPEPEAGDNTFRGLNDTLDSYVGKANTILHVSTDEESVEASGELNGGQF